MNKKGDTLGDRMKGQYENRTRYFLPRRTYTLIRVDGKAFHTFTKKAKRPFCSTFMNDMDYTAMEMVREIQGARFAYVQSDEISVLLTDFDSIQTDAWFDGNIQKISSISASIATAAFTKAWLAGRFPEDYSKLKFPHFDARVYTIPDAIEVANYFIWRQQDATRNSIQMAAQALYSHKELHGRNGDQLQEMIWQKGINWNDYTPREKRGGFVERSEPNELGRCKIEMKDCPIFTQEPEFLAKRIPRIV